MAAKSEQWKTILAAVSTTTAVVLGAVHLAGLGSCSDYMSKAEAAQVQSRNDKIHEANDTRQRSILKSMSEIERKVDVLLERTKNR